MSTPNISTTTSMTLANVLMITDTYKCKIDELRTFLKENVRQRLTEEEIPLDVPVKETEFHEKLELYVKLLHVVIELQAIINMENNSDIEQSKALCHSKSIDNEIETYKSLVYFTKQKNLEIVDKKSAFNSSSKMYDIEKKIDRFVTYMTRRNALNKLNQLEKKKKQLQMNIHQFNHTRYCEVPLKFINIF